MQAMGPTGFKRRPPTRQRPPETQEQRDQRWVRDKAEIEEDYAAPSTAQWAVRNPVDAITRGAHLGYDTLRKKVQQNKQTLVPSFLRNRRKTKGNTAQATNY